VERIKFYFDENVSNAITNGLRLRGVDVLTAQEANKLGAPDETHLGFAGKLKRVIFTQDADFLRFHAKGMAHNGIVYAHQQKPIGEIIRGLVLICEIIEPGEIKNKVEYL